jgi:hypothetical protein
VITSSMALHGRCHSAGQEQPLATLYTLSRTYRSLDSLFSLDALYWLVFIKHQVRSVSVPCLDLYCLVFIKHIYYSINNGLV